MILYLVLFACLFAVGLIFAFVAGYLCLTVPWVFVGNAVCDALIGLLYLQVMFVTRCM